MEKSIGKVIEARQGRKQGMEPINVSSKANVVESQQRRKHQPQ